MKRAPVLTLSVFALFLFFMIWDFRSPAAQSAGTTRSNSVASANDDDLWVEPRASAEKESVPQEAKRKAASGDSGDPDLPPGVSGIDKETYLQLRAAYIARLRGFDLEHPEKNDPAARGRAIRQMEEQETRIAGSNQSWFDRLLGGSGMSSPAVAWTALGPAPIPNGQTTSRSDPVSGRVTTIAVHPTNPNIAYIGAAQGGVWRTTDGGVSWTALMDTALSLAIGSIAIAPSSPSTVFVGTGEGNSSLDSFFGVGVYRITNADGATPTVAGPFATDGVNNVLAGRGITKVLVNPNDANTIFVSTIYAGGGPDNSFDPSRFPARGIYRSTNALGATPTFTKLNVTAANGGDRRVTDMVFDPGDANHLICNVGGSGAAGDGGLYLSMNALDPTPSNVTFTQELIIGNFTNVKFAINKVGGTVTVLAASGEVEGGGGCAAHNGLVRKSTDGGVTWPTKLTAADGFCDGQCYYDIGLAIDPNDATKIYLGGQAEPNPMGDQCRVLYARSTNGGTSFNTGVSVGLHADVHAITIAPNTTSTIYFGSDGGVWKSTDSGATWTSLNNAPLNTVQFESLALHPTDRNFTIGGTQDNGTEFQNPASVWTRADFGDGGFSLIDQNAADTTNVTMYHTYFNLPNRLIGYAEVDSTTNAHDNGWNLRGCSGVTPGNGINCTDSVLFYAPMARGPGNPNTVYFGTDRLYRSADKGVNNAVVSQAPFASTCGAGAEPCPVSAVGISPTDDNVRIVGLSNGKVFRTTTGSAALDDVTGTIPANYIARAVIDPNNANTAYVTLSGFGVTHVWKTTNLNAGAPTWTAASGAGGTTIPDVPVDAFVIDPNNSNNLFAGTDIGVYNSTDGGATWNPFGTGLPRVAVFDMAIQNPNRILRIATHGRGMWEISLGGAGTPGNLQFSQAAYTVNEGCATATITVNRTGGTSGTVTVDFATSDGTALQRTNYTLATGTLTLGDGVSSQTFNVLITKDAYRETPNKFLNLTLTNATGGATLGAQNTATLTIIDDTTVPTNSQPIDDAGTFVCQHYHDFLSREPDQNGLAYWTGQITQCGSNQTCINGKRIDVSNAFFFELEYQQTAAYVFRLWRAAYGNSQPFPNPDNSNPAEANKLPSYAVFSKDRARLIGSSNLAQDQLALANLLVTRAEFLSKYPANLSAGDFINAVLQTIKDADGADLFSQTSNLMTLYNQRGRGAVIYRLADDNINTNPINNRPFIDAEYNRAFVYSQYAGYLRRDADIAGFLFWLGQVGSCPLRNVGAQHAMVCSFITSAEYQNRFSAAVTHTNAECPQGVVCSP